MHILAPALNCVTNHIILPVHQAVFDITRYTPVSRLIEPCTSGIVDLLWTNRNFHNIYHVLFVKEATAKLTARTYILISAVVLFNASVSTSCLLATAAVVIGLYAGLHGIYLVDRALAAHFYCEPNARYYAFLNGIGMKDKPFGSGFKALFCMNSLELRAEEHVEIDQYQAVLTRLNEKNVCNFITTQVEHLDFTAACQDIQQYACELQQAINYLRETILLLIELTKTPHSGRKKANKLQDCNNLITQAHRNAKKAWQLLATLYEQPNLKLHTARADADDNPARPRLIPALRATHGLANKVEDSIKMLEFVTDTIEQNAEKFDEFTRNYEAFLGHIEKMSLHMEKISSLKRDNAPEEYTVSVEQARKELQETQILAPLVKESNNPLLIHYSWTLRNCS